MDTILEIIYYYQFIIVFLGAITNHENTSGTIYAALIAYSDLQSYISDEDQK